MFLYDDVSGSFWRIVPTDGRKHRADADESYLGDAVGRWEGDTLVIETVNFNEDTWLTDDGAFHTRALRVTERLSRDGDTMEWAPSHDPRCSRSPGAAAARLKLTDRELAESPRCEDRSLPHMQAIRIRTTRSEVDPFGSSERRLRNGLVVTGLSPACSGCPTHSHVPSRLTNTSM